MQMSEAHHFLIQSEIENLALSAKFMAYIIGLRFLTDHIDGDRYFKIHHPDHNLQRCRAQFQLVRSIESHYQEMREVINTLGKKYSETKVA
jgi:hypothetical protein